jgi:tetratricopeptide (TPR) repeat protein
MRQAFASPRFQQYLSTRTATESRPSLAPPGTLGGIQIDSRVVVVPRPSPTAPAELGRAEELFRRALERDSGLVEARLRLAHVLGDRGRHKEAREQLLQATRAPLPRLLDYYGSLLLGREEQAAGNGDAARRAFERAAALFPSAKSPRIALSHLALMRGDRQEAVTVLAPAGGATPMADEDPWDVIHRLHDPFAHELIARFRQELAR